MAEFALHILKYFAILFALFPIAWIVSTPVILIWPSPKGSTWRETVRSRYRRVSEFVWGVVGLANVRADF